MKKNTHITVYHDCGFFSCCTVRLYRILEFFNINKRLPESIDSSRQFSDYKEDQQYDYTFEFFQHYNNGDEITYSNNIDPSSAVAQVVHINWQDGEDSGRGNCMKDYQFSDYKLLNFEVLKPFIDKYFSPSDAVNNIIADLEKKYNIDYENLTACYYRGTDKVIETNLIPFDQYMEKVREIKNEHPETRFLLSTDEPEYRKIFIKEFPDTIIMSELLSDMRSFQHGLLMFANVIIMSKAKYIICTSSNVSIWMMLHRSHAKNTYQYIPQKILLTADNFPTFTEIE